MKYAHFISKRPSIGGINSSSKAVIPIMYIEMMKFENGFTNSAAFSLQRSQLKIKRLIFLLQELSTKPDSEISQLYN